MTKYWYNSNFVYRLFNYLIHSKLSLHPRHASAILLNIMNFVLSIDKLVLPELVARYIFRLWFGKLNLSLLQDISELLNLFFLSR